MNEPILERKMITPSIPTRTATDDVRVDMLTTIKGVSETTAKNLLKALGCIMEIGDSNLKELTIVKGIGNKVADRINNVLNSNEKVKQ